MNGKPLIVDTNDARLTARAYNLGMKLVPNLVHVLSEAQLEYWEDHLPDLKEALSKSLLIPSSQYLRLISGEQRLVLAPTDGTRTFVKSAAMFLGYFDPNFQNWNTDVPSTATAETLFQVYEQVKNGNFAQVFGSLENLKRPHASLFFTQDQAIEVIASHATWLHPKGWATFIPFTAGDEALVAYVDRDDGGKLLSGVYHFSFDHVWRAEDRRRFVVPQLTA